MSVFQVIAQNLLGFDLIIFVAAALNGVCYYFARKNADRLYRKLHMIVFVPSRRNDPDSVSKAIRDVDEEQVVAMRKRTRRASPEPSVTSTRSGCWPCASGPRASIPCS